MSALKGDSRKGSGTMCARGTSVSVGSSVGVSVSETGVPVGDVAAELHSMALPVACCPLLLERHLELLLEERRTSHPNCTQTTAARTAKSRQAITG